MPHCKPRRNTTYHQRYCTLSSLDVHTIGKVQHIWTLCILQLKLAEQLVAFSLMLKLDNNEDFLMMMMKMFMHHFVRQWKLQKVK